MLKWLHETLKWLIAEEEMLTLERYRIACEDADRWLSPFSRSASETAKYIHTFATKGGVCIGMHRDKIEKIEEARGQ